MNNKKILDVTCGSRSIWFDKTNPAALFTDIRKESLSLSDGRILNVAPDMKIDFTNIPFDSNTFYLVVFDPPHSKNIGRNFDMGLRYGRLKSGWRKTLRAASMNVCGY